MLIMPFKFMVYISLIHSTFSLAFPGMVHFALIDRSFDELTTPSLSIDNHVVREFFSCDADIVMEACRFSAGCLSFREFPMWRRGHRSREKVLVSFFEGRYALKWSPIERGSECLSVIFGTTVYSPKSQPAKTAVYYICAHLFIH